VNIQSDAMMEIAGDDCYITSGQHKETGLFHGLLWVSHPTISGTERWLILASDNRGFKTHKEACVKIKEALFPYYQYIKVMEE
jgi:hypothetical protein